LQLELDSAAISAAFLNETFDLGLQRLQIAQPNQELSNDQLVMVLENLQAVARCQMFIDQDSGLYATRINHLSSAWLLFLESKQELTKGR
jgi:hypothetical protein